jgi:isoamylase
VYGLPPGRLERPLCERAPSPFASINFVTAHDGFTLADLVSYDHKHNEANGEDNRDGSDDNRSWNCGTEGPTDDADAKALRAQQRRNLLATLLLSQGVPMLLHGDELGRTQAGNNNAYCQDNEISWIDWAHSDREFLAFVTRLSRLRSAHPVFRRRRFFEGRPVRGTNLDDIAWLTPDGTEMTDADWRNRDARALGVFLNGFGIHRPRPIGTAAVDDSFLLLFNAHGEPIRFVLPGDHLALAWRIEVDTSSADGSAGDGHTTAELTLPARSLVVLRAENSKLRSATRSALDPSSRASGR